VVAQADSGVFVMPMITSPARRYLATSSESWVATTSAKSRDPLVEGMPATDIPRSLTTNGTPPKGPLGVPWATSARAASRRSAMMALGVGLRASSRLMAA
jgi:hypothetical protein